jgi:hypothetical protein
MVAYCTAQDVYDLGLPPRAFAAVARPFDSVNASTGTIAIKAHGLAVGDVVTFEVADGGQLPTGIAVATTYYPIPVTSDLFRVSASPSGSAITFVSAGAGWAVAVDPVRRINVVAEEVSRRIDESLTADDPPIVPYSNGSFPGQLVGLAARMTARFLVTSLQFDNAEFRVASDRLFAQEEWDNELMKTWRSGKPLNPRPVDQTTTVENGAVGYSDRDASCWQPGVL